jgi:molecular chaperone HscB
MTYFDFFGLEPKFGIDKKELKILFLENSKKYHPDFFTLENEAKKEEVMQLSTQNNEAYKCLNKDESRMKYILQLKGIDVSDKAAMPQSFLIDMMDINEQIMELEMEFDAANHSKINEEVAILELGINSNLKAATTQYDATSEAAQLEIVKEFYLKNRYLLRIKESLHKFAPH